MSIISKLNRRSFAARVLGAGLVGGGALAAVTGSRAQTSSGPRAAVDADKRDGGPGTRVATRDGRSGPTSLSGHTDRDSTDWAESGRGPARTAQTGVTDRDATDRPGFGRGQQHINRLRTGANDADPTDAQGYGVRSHTSRITDVDCTDAPGSTCQNGRRVAAGGRRRAQAPTLDPTDNPGRHRPATEITDQDPTDPANYGRGARSR